MALKLLAHGALDKVSPGPLLREAQTASSLGHPNICTIHQVGETGTDFYVVMELIEGRSLIQYGRGEYQSCIWQFRFENRQLVMARMPCLRHSSQGPYNQLLR